MTPNLKKLVCFILKPSLLKPEGYQKASRGPPGGLLEAGRPKLVPERPKLAPGRPKLAPGRPKLAPERPKLVPGRLKLAPGRPKLVSSETLQRAPGANLVKKGSNRK